VCSKLWRYSGYALQQSSDDVTVESATAFRPSKHTFFTDDTQSVINCDPQQQTNPLNGSDDF
jgi:hypothetical protein